MDGIEPPSGDGLWIGMEHAVSLGFKEKQIVYDGNVLFMCIIMVFVIVKMISFEFAVCVHERHRKASRVLWSWCFHEGLSVWWWYLL